MKFLTIAQEAALHIVPEFRIRQMLKQGRLPGYRAGNRYYVNHDMLIAQLEAECLQNVHSSNEEGIENA